MKIDGKLFIAFIMALALIPGACAISIGGGTSISGSGSAQGNVVANGNQATGSINAIGAMSVNADHWVQDKTGKRAEVDANVPSASSVKYTFSLNPNNDKKIVAAQDTLTAQESLDVTNAKTKIQADAISSNGEGDKAQVGVNMGAGTLVGYTNSATATNTQAATQQSANSASGSQITFSSTSSHGKTLSSDVGISETKGSSVTLTGYVGKAYASATQVNAVQSATSGSGKSITITGDAKDRSGTYSVNSPLSGSFNGLSASSLAGTSTQVSQMEQIVGSFSGTASAPGKSNTKTRTSNFGVKYDLSMLAAKGSSPTGTVGYYIDPTMATKSLGAIQGAVNAAQSGDTINAAAGTYKEAVNINKGLTLKGSGNPTANSFSLTNSAILGAGSGGITAPLITVNAGSKIQDGITLASTNGKVNVNAGIYGDNLDQSFYAKGVTLTGFNNPVTNSLTLNQDVAGKISGITANTVTVNPNAKILQGIDLANTGATVNVNGATGYIYSDDLTQGFYAKSITLTGISSPITNSISLDQLVAGKIGGITANTVNVLNPNAKIQDGIDLAAQGGTVNVGAGTYKENVGIGKSIVVNGAGAGTDPTKNTIVDGQQAGSVFTTSGNVALTGMTIQGGTGAKTLVMVNVQPIYWIVGGGISNSGTLTLNGVTITGNTANYGGGIWNRFGGFLILNGGSITGNTGAVDGGGVYNAGTMTMNGGSITGNIANYYGGDCGGGGIYNGYCGFLIMNGGSITGNTADDGGGIYNDNLYRVPLRNGAVTMNSGSITGNTANYGGGIYNYAQSTFTIAGGSITGNTANYYGGGIYNGGALKLDGTQVVVKSNKAHLPDSESNWYQGWGVYSGDQLTTINGFDPTTQVTDNTQI